METRVSIAFDKGLRTGDTFTLTSGREVYPVGRGSFEVGPVQATVTVQAGEEPVRAYERTRALLEALFEAEWQVKKAMFLSRLEEMCEKN